jgi:hypothetical protein
VNVRKRDFWATEPKVGSSNLSGRAFRITRKQRGFDDRTVQSNTAAAVRSRAKPPRYTNNKGKAIAAAETDENAVAL